MMLSASVLSWITFFIFIKYHTFCTAQYQGEIVFGDDCTVDNTPGICIRLENCDPVREELMRGISPRTTCGYDKFHPIICCPKSSGTTTTTQRNFKETTAKPTDAPTTRASVTAELSLKRPTENPADSPTTKANPTAGLPKRPVGAKAKAKCEEYSKYVPYNTLNVFGEIFKEPICIKSHTLVVGGYPVEEKEFPFMTAVGYGNLENGTIHWDCGGSLISEKFVITAAHCTYNLNWGKITWVRLGVLTHERNGTKEFNPQDIRVVESIKHPQYKWPAEYHDIAILKLERAVTITDWVRPTCLPYSLPSDTGAVAMGWGQTEWAGDPAKYLLRVSIKIKSHEECNATFTGGLKDDRLKLGIVDDWQLCAGDYGKDTCQGDSGGPLVFTNKEYACMGTLVGVTSLGKFCGGTTPGIYTRVYHYVSWIEDVVWPDL